MSSITIYLDDTLEARLRNAATQEGISVSKLVAKLVEERTADAWPADFLSLAGSWPDVDRVAHGPDVPRQSL